jgi:hypothetical protein
MNEYLHSNVVAVVNLTLIDLPGLTKIAVGEFVRADRVHLFRQLDFDSINVAFCGCMNQLEAWSIYVFLTFMFIAARN